MGAGLVAAGLLISKGAKKKRQEAKDIIQDQKKIALDIHPGGLKISF